jgi:hypothetical protein
MPNKFEPDSQFVDRLEWQLASEFRRMDRLKMDAGKVAVPRRVAALSLAAGVLLMGVAATKAADLIKDSWRKKIEVARLETEVKIKRAFLEFKQLRAAQAEEKSATGLIDEEGAQGSRLAALRAEFDLDRSLLDLEETQASGVAPCDELYAPLVGGRDFVSERLEIEKKALALELDHHRGRIERSVRPRVELGLIPKSDLEAHLAMLAAREARIGELETRSGLRRSFLGGEISAEGLEVQTRLTEAERKLSEAQSDIAAMTAHLDNLKAKLAAGLISIEEFRGTQTALEAAQAQVSLALQEIEILKKIR